MNGPRGTGFAWLGSRGRAAALCGIGLFVFSACASLRFEGVAGLQITCNVPDASLLIDDVYLGPVSEWQVEVRLIKPGSHRIEVRHPDYYVYYAELLLKAGDTRHLDIVLHRLLD